MSVIGGSSGSADSPGFGFDETETTPGVLRKPKRGVCMFVPEISEDKCKQCGECVDICPADVLAVDSNVTKVANPADCLGCESCVSVCPEEAITIKEV
jgi:NAD-dependent dihydropyrimidine dehydrogenase PreA subunit